MFPLSFRAFRFDEASFLLGDGGLLVDNGGGLLGTGSETVWRLNDEGGLLGSGDGGSL